MPGQVTNSTRKPLADGSWGYDANGNPIGRNPDGSAWGYDKNGNPIRLGATDESRQKQSEIDQVTTFEGGTGNPQTQTPGSTAPTVRGTAAPAGTPRAADRIAAGGGAVAGSGTGVYTPSDWNAPTATPATAPPPAPATAPPPATPSAPPPLAGPGAYEKWIDENSGKLRDPTRIEKLYGETPDDYTNVDGGAYKDWRAQNQDAFAGPGRREQIADQAIDAAFGVGDTTFNYTPTGTSFNYSAPTLDAAEGVFAAGERDLSGAGAMEAKYAEMGDALDGPSNLDAIYAAYGIDPLSSKSYSEQLFESGIGRLNPYYDLAGQRAIGKAQRASSARGGFNSGLAAQQESDILSDLAGEQAMAQERLAPIADAERRSRYDQGFRFAGDTDAEKRARVESSFGIAKDAQDAEEGRFRTRGDLAHGADASAEAEGRLGLDAERARADTDLASQRLGLDAERARADTDIAADRNRLEGIRTAGDAAGDADASYRDRIRDTGDMAARQDELDLKREQEERQRQRDLYDFAGRADDSEMGRFGAEAGLMKDRQATAEKRIGDAIDRTFGLDSKEADIASRILSDMDGVEKIDEAWIQAELEKLGIPLERRQFWVDIIKNSVQTGAKLAGAL